MKKKLFVSVMSLVMAIVLMTSTSFAWFTVSTAPEVSDIDVTMTATKNLEIAKAGSNMTTPPAEVAVGDAGTETKWGAKITTFAGTVDFPAINSSGIKTISYDASGRVNADYVAATAPNALTDGVGYYTADIKYGTNTILSGAKVAAVFGVWLRSNVSTTVTTSVTDANGVAIKNSEWDIVLANASGTPLTNNEVSLTANTATAVQVIIFAKGDQVEAADVASDLKIENIKLTFSSTDITSFATQHTPTP